MHGTAVRFFIDFKAIAVVNLIFALRKPDTEKILEGAVYMLYGAAEMINRKPAALYRTDIFKGASCRSIDTDIAKTFVRECNCRIVIGTFQNSWYL